MLFSCQLCADGATTGCWPFCVLPLDDFTGERCVHALTTPQVINVGFAVAQLVSAAVQAVNMALAAYMIALV